MPTQHMIDIDNALRFLLVAFFTGAAGIIGTVVLAAKWYIPRRLRQQTAERQVQLNALRIELENKHAMEAVDLEKERMLPMAFQSNQLLVAETIKMGQSFNLTMQQRNEQDAITAAAINASTKQLTANTDRLDENTDRLEAVEKQLSKLYDKVLVAFPRDINIEAVLNELKGAMDEIKKACAEKKKGDSKEIPVITLPSPTDKGTILITGVLPEDLPKTGTDG